MRKQGYIITPSDLTEEPIELSQKVIEKYEQYVSEELFKFIDIIQFGLSFFDIKAYINENNKNQIDFYDSNNNLLCSKKIEAPKTKTEYVTCLLKAQFSERFRTDIGELFMKSEPIDEDSENYYFDLICGDYSKSLFIARRNGEISSIDVAIYGQKDFNIKKISVSKMDREWVCFELDDVFGPNGNHEVGKARKLNYHESKSNMDIYASIIEKYAHKKSKFVYLDSSHTSMNEKGKNKITIWENNNREEFEIPSVTMLDYISKFLSHPRSKETISYVEGEMEREFTGMISFIKNNFDVYNKITGLTYEEDPKFEELINGIILPECDFTTEKQKKLVKR